LSDMREELRSYRKYGSSLSPKEFIERLWDEYPHELINIDEL